MRCFIAVEIEPALRHSVWELTAPLRAVDAEIRWVAERNFHLTIKFLGETPSGAIDGISRALENSLVGLTEFDLAFRGCGAFPNLRNPHVVWVGLVGFGRLMAIQSAVEPAMVKMGFRPEERAFSPHLTIGRVKGPRGMIAMADEIAKLRSLEFGACRVRGVALMQSELSPTGPTYTRLLEAPLAGLE